TCNLRSHRTRAPRPRPAAPSGRPAPATGHSRTSPPAPPLPLSRASTTPTPAADTGCTTYATAPANSATSPVATRRWPATWRLPTKHGAPPPTWPAWTGPKPPTGPDLRSPPTGPDLRSPPTGPDLPRPLTRRRPNGLASVPLTGSGATGWREIPAGPGPTG